MSGEDDWGVWTGRWSGCSGEWVWEPRITRLVPWRGTRDEAMAYATQLAAEHPGRTYTAESLDDGCGTGHWGAKPTASATGGAVSVRRLGN